MTGINNHSREHDLGPLFITSACIGTQPFFILDVSDIRVVTHSLFNVPHDVP